MSQVQQSRAMFVPAGDGRALWFVGDTYTFKATAAETDGALAFVEAVVPPQAGPPPHIHHRESEAMYVLEGELEFLCGDKTLTADPGSFLFVPPGVLHAFKNGGSAPSKMLFLHTPAGFEGFLLEAGEPAVGGLEAPAPSADDLEKAITLGPKYGMEIPSPRSSQRWP